jgi:peptidoglycan L-alanyl-D-glutamate endopeptidase CwlK
MRLKHENNGKCARCAEFLKEADPTLRTWFEAEQAKDFELHVACSTRGRRAQDAALEGGKSKAAYGSSPHNYFPSMALDLFFQINGEYALIWSRLVAIAKRKPKEIIWGADWNDNGRSDDERFKDSPHFEVKGWKTKVKNYPNGAGMP